MFWKEREGLGAGAELGQLAESSNGGGVEAAVIYTPVRRDTFCTALSIGESAAHCTTLFSLLLTEIIQEYSSEGISMYLYRKKMARRHETRVSKSRDLSVKEEFSQKVTILKLILKKKHSQDNKYSYLQILSSRQIYSSYHLVK